MCVSMSSINKESKDRENHKYSLTIWVSWLFLVASLLLLPYTYYRAEMIHLGTRDIHYSKYYLISLVGVLFWGLVLRLREAIRANIVTLVISVIVALYLVEGWLAFWRPEQYIQGAKAVMPADLGIKFDQRTKLEVIEDLLEDGVDAVPAIRPTYAFEGRVMFVMNEKLLPLGGISKKITVGENENGRRMIYPSDRYGFNNPDSEWDAKKVEWLLTGDSFTEGVSVQPGEDIAGQLRVITKEPAISLGRGGNGPLLELAELEEYSVAIKPKSVLWLFYELNDLHGDLRIERENPLLMQYMQDRFSQNLINRQDEIDGMLENFIIDQAVTVPITAAVNPVAIPRMLYSSKNVCKTL